MLHAAHDICVHVKATELLFCLTTSAYAGVIENIRVDRGGDFSFPVSSGAIFSICMDRNDQGMDAFEHAARSFQARLPKDRPHASPEANLYSTFHHDINTHISYVLAKVWPFFYANERMTEILYDLNQLFLLWCRNSSTQRSALRLTTSATSMP